MNIRFGIFWRFLQFFSVLVCCACWLFGQEVDFSTRAMELNRSGGLSSWQVYGTEVVASGQFSGFTVKDVHTGQNETLIGEVAEDGDATVWRGTSQLLQLRYEARYTTYEDTAIAVDFHISDTSGQDRALDLNYQLGVIANDWMVGNSWTDNPRNEETAQPGRGYNQCDSLAGHPVSQLPFLSLTSGSLGIALGHDMAKPLLAAYYYNMDGNREGTLRVVLPVGLASEPEQFCREAHYTFYLYSFDGEYGQRGAVAAYYRLFPTAFQNGETPAGGWALWIPSENAAVARDCGMLYNQCEFEYSTPEKLARKVKTMQDVGLFAVQYNEPWGYWHPMPPDWCDEHQASVKVRSNSLACALDTTAFQQYLSGDLADDTASDRFPGCTRSQVARAIQNTAIWDSPQGSWGFNVYGKRNFVWGKTDRRGWDSVIVLANSDPELPHPNRWDITWETVGLVDKWLTDAGLAFNGVYWDSGVFMLGWNEVDYCRGHWRTSPTPLIWARTHDGQKSPAELLATTNSAFLRKAQEYCHQRGWFTIINTWNPVSLFCAPFVDVLGAGEHSDPKGLPSLRDFEVYRIQSYHKPISLMDYCLNFVHLEATEENVLKIIEPRINAILQYGIFPGTGNSWDSAEKIALIRPVLARYRPLFTAIHAAGWEPLTYAKTDEALLLERWGSSPEGGLFFTLRNEGKKTVDTVLEVDLVQLPAATQTATVRELVDQADCTFEVQSSKLRIPLAIPSGRTRLVQLMP